MTRLAQRDAVKKSTARRNRLGVIFAEKDDYIDLNNDSMPEIRRDVFTGRTVIVAPDRAGRPNAVSGERAKTTAEGCPFCAGHEEETPAAVFTLPTQGGEDASNWQARVVPNKYPALTPSDAPFDATFSEPFSAQPGVGMHEVVIESPNHLTDFAALSDEAAACCLMAYRDRLLAAREDRQLRWAMVFRNVGENAGASLSHLHSQVIGLPLVPEEVTRRLAVEGDHFEQTGQTLWAKVIEHERVEGRRVLFDADGLFALCPYASRFSYEMVIVPTTAGQAFEDQTDAQLAQVAVLLRNLLKSLAEVAGHPAYNVLLYTTPFDTSRTDPYHWRIEILPRVAKIAGFEWATGVMVNIVTPEVAAQRLRSAGCDSKKLDNL